MFFKSSHFCFQNALEQITSCFFQELCLFRCSRLSRIIWQVIEGIISSFLTKDIENPMILPLQGRCLPIPKYFCAVYDYAGKADLSKAYWNPKRKLGVTTHFSEIIKQ